MEFEIKNGDEVKASKGLIEGYLVKFSDENKPDLYKDFFTKNTYFGEIKRIPVYYEHGFNEFLDKNIIGIGDLELKNDGIYIKAKLEIKNPQQFKKKELERHQEYLNMINELGEEGVLGWSSGAAAHLVERVKSQFADAHEIQQWLIAEASLTPRPADTTNVATVKSIYNKYGLDFEVKKGAAISKNRRGRLQGILNELTKLLDETEPDDDDQEKNVTIQNDGEDITKKSLVEIKETIEDIADVLENLQAYIAVVKSDNELFKNRIEKQDFNADSFIKKALETDEQLIDRLLHN